MSLSTYAQEFDSANHNARAELGRGLCMRPARYIRKKRCMLTDSLRTSFDPTMYRKPPQTGKEARGHTTRRRNEQPCTPLESLPILVAGAHCSQKRRAAAPSACVWGRRRRATRRSSLWCSKHRCSRHRPSLGSQTAGRTITLIRGSSITQNHTPASLENFPTVIGLSVVLSPLARRRLPPRSRRAMALSVRLSGRLQEDWGAE
jgi:hypothetical protein